MIEANGADPKERDWLQSQITGIAAPVLLGVVESVESITAEGLNLSGGTLTLWQMPKKDG